jgi:hypothetical protein
MGRPNGGAPVFAAPFVGFFGGQRRIPPILGPAFIGPWYDVEDRPLHPR